MMRMLLCLLIGGMVTLAPACNVALAQSSGAEARLQERNIILPPEPAPVANYVNAVRVGNLLFLSGNTPGPDWTPKGKVGKELTVEEATKLRGASVSSCWRKCEARSGALTASSAS